MKKYLLLASVAGCLMANNAMATSYESVANAQQATVSVNATITSVCALSDGTIEFGTLYVMGGEPFTADIDYDGNITGSSTVLNKSFTGVTAGLASGSGCNFNEVDTNITCVGGGDTTTGCTIGTSDYKIIPIVSNDGSSESSDLAAYGRLVGTAPSTAGTSATVSGTAFVVTLDY